MTHVPLYAPSELSLMYVRCTAGRTLGPEQPPELLWSR